MKSYIGGLKAILFLVLFFLLSFFYIIFPSHYYTFDSLYLILPGESWNVASFGYDAFLDVMSFLYHLSGISSLSFYSFFSIVQTIIVAAGFSLFFLLLVLKIPECYQEKEYKNRLLLAFGITLIAGFSGPAVRFVTIAENYILTAILGAISWGLWFQYRNNSGSWQFILSLILLTFTVFFDIVAVFFCAPVILYSMIECFNKRRWSSLFTIVAIILPGVLTVLYVYSKSYDAYQNMYWGDHGVNIENIISFGKAVIRLIVYIVSPSLPLLKTYFGFALASAAFLTVGTFLLVLLWRFQRGKIDIAYIVIGLGLIVRTFFAFWWQPSNTEQLVSPFIIGLFLIGHKVLHQTKSLERIVFHLAIISVCCIISANVALVSLPTSRWQQDYFSLLDGITTVLPSVAEKESVIIVEDESFEVYMNAKPFVLSSTEANKISEYKFLTFNLRARSPKTETEYDEELEELDSDINSKLKKQVPLYLLYSRTERAEHFSNKNRYAASILGKKVFDFRLNDFLKRIYKLDSLNIIDDYFLYAIYEKDDKEE